jgi:integrase
VTRNRGATPFWWTRQRGGRTERVAAVDFVDERGRARRLIFPTMAAAKACAEEKRAQLRRRDMGLESAGPQCDKTLWQLCTWWLETCCRPRSRSREASRLRVQVELERSGKSSRRIGRAMAAEVTGAALEDHFDQLQAEGLSGSSVNKLRQTLRTVFNKARKRGVLRVANPVLDTEPRPENPVEYHVLEVDQIGPMLAQVEPAWRDLFAAAVLLGLRKGELFGAHKADVDAAARTLRVRRSHGAERTKTDEVRELPIPGALWPYVQHALDTFPGAHLFPDPAGRPHRPDIKLERKLRAALGRAGICDGYVHKCRRCAAAGTPHHERHPDATPRRCPSCQMLLWPSAVAIPMRFHELRHSTATLLAALGVPETVRADILGHRTRAMTRRYTHLSVEQMREGLGRMDVPGLQAAAPGASCARPAGVDRPVESAKLEQPDAARFSGRTDSGLTKPEG